MKNNFQFNADSTGKAGTMALKQRIFIVLSFLLAMASPLSAQLATWDASGLTGGGPSVWAPLTIDPNLTTSGLTKGGGLGGATAGAAWGGNNFGGAANQDFTVTVTANANYQVSFSAFNFSYRRSGTGPTAGSFMYALGSSTTYSVITGSLAFSGTATNGVPVSISLSGVSDLQNVPAGTAVKFRLLPSGGAAAGTFYFNTSGAASITGTVTPAVVTPSFAATIAQTASIQCNGQSTAQLTASVTAGTNSPFTYSWSPAGGTSSVATGLAAGIYSCLVTSATSETTISTFTVTQPAVLSASVTAKNISCNGSANGSATVSAVGGTGPFTYTWSPAASNSATLANLTAGTYTVNLIDANNCAASNTLSIAEPAVLTSFLAQSNATCNGGANGSATLVAAGGTPAYSYTWLPTGGNNSTAPNLTGGTYTVYVSDTQSCTISKTLTITQPSTIFSITASASSTVVCSGSTITLTGSGASTYTWTNGVTDGIAFTPSASTLYTVTGKDASGCNGAGSVSVTVNITPTLTVNSGAVCPGGIFVMTPGGASTYTYSSGSATVTPSSSSMYTVTGTSAQGCAALSTAISTVNIVGSLTVSISGPTVICFGETANLTAGGASTYTWSTGSQAYTIAPTPTVSTTYSVTGASGSCSNTAVTTISINALPVVSISGSSVVCAGTTATLTASGANSYTWNTGSASVSITPTPTTGTVYTVTATGANGCTVTAVKTVTASANPTIAVSGGTSCAGATFTLVPSGAVTYTFSNGSATVNPTITTSYSVSGTNSLGCVSPSPAVATISVIAAPVISVVSGSICSGKSFTISTSGASTYTFSGGASVVNPTVTTTYSVTGTNTAGCVSLNPALSTVTVNALPVIAVAGNTAICNGGSVTLTASGANSYTWNSGSNTASLAVTPSLTTTYTVTGTGANTCSNSVLFSLTVNPIPTITIANGQICPGDSFTLSPTGAATYSFSNGPVVSPTVTTSYSVAGTSSAGCVSSSSAVAVVTVTNSLALTVSGSTLVCNGEPANLAGVGATSYTWSTGALTTTITPVISANVSYTVLGSTGNCSNTAVVSVSVLPLPVVTVASTTNTICNGDAVILTGSGATTYTFTNGVLNATPFSPSVTATYSVTGTDANGCKNSTTTAVNVNANPAVTITLSNSVICSGTTATLTAGGALSYSWNTSATTSVVAVSPLQTTSYSVTGTDVNGCKTTTVASQEVSPCTGINAIAVTEQSFVVFPNPTTGDFTIKANLIAPLMLINELGQTVLVIDQNSAINGEVQVKGLNAGIYFLSGSFNNSAVKQKIVVTK